MEDKGRVVIYTDGSCLGNPGVGGWGVRLKWRGFVKDLRGSCNNTTNNRMELTAVIEALKALKKRSRVLLVTDSNYVKKGMEEWIISWENNNWKTSAKKKIKNKDLWQLLLGLSREHDIEWKWVKAHNLDKDNCDVDHIARSAALKLKEDS